MRLDLLVHKTENSHLYLWKKVIRVGDAFWRNFYKEKVMIKNQDNKFKSYFKDHHL